MGTSREELNTAMTTAVGNAVTALGADASAATVTRIATIYGALHNANIDELLWPHDNQEYLCNNLIELALKIDANTSAFLQITP